VNDETWISFVNVETKEQSKQSMHTHSPEKPKKIKHRLSARKLMAAVFWDSKGGLMLEFMQLSNTAALEVHCETLKELHGADYSEQKACNADIRCSTSP
jgi:hypothetical protein